MNKLLFFKCLVLSILVGFSSCSNDDDEETTPENTPNDNNVDVKAFFNSSALISFEVVPCNLENGTSSECYEMVFRSNPVANGPYCPKTINDIGGLAIYDGATNPGFQVMKAKLFNAMEADGYDIVDENGNIRVEDFQSGAPNRDFYYCLDAAANDNLQLKFLIPTTPTLLSSPNDISEIELVGVSLDGVPINGNPPSATQGPAGRGSAGIPSLDPCGGHQDPAGYYHWHFIAEAMNEVLKAQGISDVSCTNIPQNTATKLVGLAKDGYPIYVYATIPNDLDECGGRTAVTNEYPDGIYHYVASNTDAPNIPKCVKGAEAKNSFSYQ